MYVLRTYFSLTVYQICSSLRDLRLQRDITRTIDLGTTEIDEILEKNKQK